MVIKSDSAMSLLGKIVWISRIPLCYLALTLTWASTPGLRAQQASPSPDSKPAVQDQSKQYSGMYSFRKDGEFVQLTIEDEGRVTGFISRYGDGESDKGAFLDQFFKTGKLEGNRLTFTTEIVHGVEFDFTGVVERGEGKNPGDEAYYVLKGTLIEKTSDVNKKVTTQSQNVLLKMFPQEASPAPAVRQ